MSKKCEGDRHELFYFILFSYSLDLPGSPAVT